MSSFECHWKTLRRGSDRFWILVSLAALPKHTHADWSEDESRSRQGGGNQAEDRTKKERKTERKRSILDEITDRMKC